MRQSADWAPDRGGGTEIVSGSTYLANLRREMEAIAAPSARRVLEACGGNSDYDRILREVREREIREGEQSRTAVGFAEWAVERATWSDLAVAIEHLPFASFGSIVPSDVPEYLGEEDAGLLAAMRRLVAHCRFVASSAIRRFIGKRCSVLVNRHWRHLSPGLLDRTNLPCQAEQGNQRSREENEYDESRLQGSYPTRGSHSSGVHALALGALADALLLEIVRVILSRRVE